MGSEGGRRSRLPAFRATGAPRSRGGSPATRGSHTWWGSTRRAPSGDVGDVDFIEADLRGALISRLLPSTEVDTVVHCGILW